MKPENTKLQKRYPFFTIAISSFWVISTTVMADQPKDVNVVNVPTVQARQKGAWEVGIRGTPSIIVNNTENNPIPVTITTPVRTPFAFCLSSWVSVCNNQNYTVPNDKILVIETISTDFRTPKDKAAWWLLNFFIDGKSFQHLFSFPLVYKGSDYDQYVGSHQTRIYAEAGSTMQVSSSSYAGMTIFDLTLSGYLVPVDSGSLAP